MSSLCPNITKSDVFAFFQVCAETLRKATQGQGAKKVEFYKSVLKERPFSYTEHPSLLQLFFGARPETFKSSTLKPDRLEIYFDTGKGNRDRRELVAVSVPLDHSPTRWLLASLEEVLRKQNLISEVNEDVGKIMDVDCELMN